MRLPEHSEDVSDFQLSIEDVLQIQAAEQAIARKLNLGLIEDAYVFRAWVALHILREALDVVDTRMAEDLDLGVPHRPVLEDRPS